MPGNETDTIIFIINNKDKLKLKYINKINNIQIPHNNKLIEVNLENIKDFYSHDSHKKADIYINNIGISLKQEGGNFSYNRLQRKNLNNFFSLFFSKDEKDDIIKKIDNKVKQFHKNEITRNFSFTDVMTKKNFFKVIKYLMLKGSPNLGETEFTAEMILVSKKKINKVEDLAIFKFNEFFDKFSNQFSFAIRRHWYGQESNSEHKRAVSILKNKDNEPWCFEESVGTPDGWRKDVAEKARKPVSEVSDSKEEVKKIDTSYDDLYAYQKKREAEREAQLEKEREKLKKKEIKFNFITPKKDWSIYGGWVNPFEPINKGRLGSTQEWRIEKPKKHYY